MVDRYTQEPLIKRVIALEGDVIDIDPETHAVSVNGEVLDEPYIATQTDLKGFSGPQKVPEGMVFVMGDNRTYSKDSRTAEIGFVEISDIVGRAVFRIWPFGSAGAL
ncbi:MAG: signal peptidase I [Acutalibacteraceae bacterium]